MPAKPALTRLREDVVLQAAPASGEGLAHDAEQHVVRNLKMAGLFSKKGRRYQPEAYADAVPLYEGIVCNIDHVPESNPDVPYDKRFGVFRNVRLLEGEPWGDLYYNPAHREAASFVWWAQNCPEAVGFSHDVLCETFIDADGVPTARKILKVFSVDLVANPASTNGLRESDDMPDPLMTDGQPQWDDQLGEMVKSIFCDASLDRAAKRKKILDALKLLDEEEEGGSENETESEDSKDSKDKDEMDEDKAMESLRKRDDPASKKAVELLESNRRDRAREARKVKVLKTARDAGLKAEVLTEVFVESLVESRDDAHLKRLIEDRRKFASGRVKEPSSAQAGGGSLNADQFVAGMRNF